MMGKDCSFVIITREDMSYNRIFAVAILMLMFPSCKKRPSMAFNTRNDTSKASKKDNLPIEGSVESKVGTTSVESNCQVAITRSLFLYKSQREDNLVGLDQVQSGLENTTNSHFIGDDGAVLIKDDQVNIKYGNDTKKLWWAGPSFIAISPNIRVEVINDKGQIVMNEKGPKILVSNRNYIASSDDIELIIPQLTSYGWVKEHLKNRLVFCEGASKIDSCTYVDRKDSSGRVIDEKRVHFAFEGKIVTIKSFALENTNCASSS